MKVFNDETFLIYQYQFKFKVFPLFDLLFNIKTLTMTSFTEILKVSFYALEIEEW